MYACFLSLFLFCFSNGVIEYQLDANQYAVVVVMDGLSASEAGGIARGRAAEMTARLGGREFVIDSEMQTEVIQSDRDEPFYGNLYEELIIEKNFSREQLRRRSLPSTETYPAIRLVFTVKK